MTPTKKTMTNCEAEKVARVLNTLSGRKLLVGCPYEDTSGICRGGLSHRVFLTKGNKDGYLYFVPCEDHLKRFFQGNWPEVTWEQVQEDV